MDLGENLAAVRGRIAAACGQAKRDPASVALVAVSKGHSPEAIEALAAQGQTLFGESRVQEARAKIPQCSERLRWHFVGHLQSNKARDAAQCFEMVHSIDSLALATELGRQAARFSRTIQVLVEINIAGEASKFGFKPPDLLLELKALTAIPRLEPRGLMTIAPWTKDPQDARPVFAGLRQLQQQCQELLGTPWPELSMGMSRDLEVAVQEGATLVRVGTDLFGPRPRLRARGDE